MEKPNIFSNLPLLTEFPTRVQWEAAVWEILAHRLTQISSEGELKRTLQLLMTGKERRTLTYRALAISRIHSRIGPREIERELWITRQTISAIKKGLAELEYKSSHKRGHVKQKSTLGSGSRPEKVRYRQTKYGRVNRDGLGFL